MDKSFSDIDLGRLEEEWLLQPKLYGRYSKKLAEAKLDLAEAKAEQELVEAQTMNHIRNNPTKYNIQKLTESAIKECMMMSADYQQSIQKVNLAKHKVDLLDGIVNTLEHRKRTLENLVTLFGQNYFSKPTVKGELKTTFSEKAKAENVGKSFTRKRKSGD